MKHRPSGPAAQPPVGLTGPRRLRLSDQETEERMLHAAADLIHRSGLTVSLEHISFEEVIQRAAVSRTAAYRRWPYKDLFFSDLLRELARANRPAATPGLAETAASLRDAALEHLDWLETVEGRRDLILELVRLGGWSDFETMLGSTEWRTYLALHATFLSIADEGLRGELQAALAASEEDFISRIARSWELVAGLLGYRLRPDLGGSFEMVATLASASLRGLVIMALSTPEIASQRIQARPFGASRSAEWSQSAMAAGCIAYAVFEPDPTIEWSQERLASVRQAIASVSFPARTSTAEPPRQASSRRRRASTASRPGPA